MHVGHDSTAQSGRNEPTPTHRHRASVASCHASTQPGPQSPHPPGTQVAACTPVHSARDVQHVYHIRCARTADAAYVQTGRPRRYANVATCTHYNLPTRTSCDRLDEHTNPNQALTLTPTQPLEPRPAVISYQAGMRAQRQVIAMASPPFTTDTARRERSSSVLAQRSPGYLASISVASR